MIIAVGSSYVHVIILLTGSDAATRIDENEHDTMAINSLALTIPRVSERRNEAHANIKKIPKTKRDRTKLTLRALSK